MYAFQATDTSRSPAATRVSRDFHWGRLYPCAPLLLWLLWCPFTCASESPPAAPGGSAGSPAALRCNGRPEYCDQKFNELTFAMTHNSFAASEKGYKVAHNHIKWIDDQLEAGIRAFMFDVWIEEQDGLLSLCHNLCMPGKDGLERGDRLHAHALATLAAFLAAHPHEVLAIAYEDYVYDGALLVDDFKAAGLDRLVYSHWQADQDYQLAHPGASGTGPWPTLRAMIAAGQRLVVMTDVKYNPAWVACCARWLHWARALSWETSYENTRVRDFDCQLDRGEPGENKLLLVNHFRNSAVRLPAVQKAERSNELATIVTHALLCNATTRPPQWPSFLAVDFWSKGQVVEAVAMVNRLRLGQEACSLDPHGNQRGGPGSLLAELWEEMQIQWWIQAVTAAVVLLVVVGCCLVGNVCYIWSLAEGELTAALDRKLEARNECPWCRAAHRRFRLCRRRRRLRLWNWLHRDHCPCPCCKGCHCCCCLVVCCYCNPVFRRRNPGFYDPRHGDYHRTLRLVRLTSAVLPLPREGFADAAGEQSRATAPAAPAGAWTSSAAAAAAASSTLHASGSGRTGGPHAMQPPEAEEPMRQPQDKMKDSGVELDI